MKNSTKLLILILIVFEIGIFSTYKGYNLNEITEQINYNTFGIDLTNENELTQFEINLNQTNQTKQIHKTNLTIEIINIPQTKNQKIKATETKKIEKLIQNLNEIHNEYQLNLNLINQTLKIKYTNLTQDKIQFSFKKSQIKINQNQKINLNQILKILKYEKKFKLPKNITIIKADKPIKTTTPTTEKIKV